MLDSFYAVTSAVKSKSYDKVKAALEKGNGIVSKRIKSIKLADKSEFGWQTSTCQASWRQILTTKRDV